jgi:hypothetical protein
MNIDLINKYEDLMIKNPSQIRWVLEQLLKESKVKKVTGKRKDNDEFVTGSLMYDFDQDCWRIITHFFDIEEPKLDNQFGVCAQEVYLDTVEACL